MLGPVDKPVAEAVRLMTEHSEARKETCRAVRLYEKKRGGMAPIRIVSLGTQRFPDARRV